MSTDNGERLLEKVKQKTRRKEMKEMIFQRGVHITKIQKEITNLKVKTMSIEELTVRSENLNEKEKELQDTLEEKKQKLLNIQKEDLGGKEIISQLESKFEQMKIGLSEVLTIFNKAISKREEYNRKSAGIEYNVFEIEKESNLLDKLIKSIELKISRFDRTQKSIPKTYYVQDPEKIRKEEWVERAMEEMPHILALRERTKHLLPHKTFSLIPKTLSVQSPKHISNREIISIILEHYQKIEDVCKFISNRTGISLSIIKRYESPLISLIRLASTSEGKEWDLSHKIVQKSSINLNDLNKITELRLPSNDISVWEEPITTSNWVIDETRLKATDDMMASIMYASINKIIMHIAHEKKWWNDLVHGFLITYRIYMSPETLFLKLKQRFTLPRKRGRKFREDINSSDTERFSDISLSESDTFSEYTEHSDVESMLDGDRSPALLSPAPSEKRRLSLSSTPRGTSIADITLHIRSDAQIKNHVMQVFNMWVDKYSLDFNPTLRNAVIQFISRQRRKYPSMSEKIIRKLGGDGDKTPIQLMIGYPKPIVPPNIFSINLKMEDIKELEFSRQYTLALLNLYSKITPGEIVNLSWTKNPSDAPYTVKLTKSFNDMAYYVATSIIKIDNCNDRTKMIDRWIKIANHLFEFQNFDGLMSIVAGLSNPAVKRLKWSWDGLSGRRTSEWELISKFTDSSGNYSRLRDKLLSFDTREKCIPFIGGFLTQVVHICETDKTIEGSIINWVKIRKIFAVYEILERFQSSKYEFIPVHQIQELFKINSSAILNNEDLYNKSLLHEPRGCSRSDVQ